MAAEDDPALRDLVACAAPVVTFVGKTWELHLEKVTRVSPEENLAMIVDSINLARAEGKRVIYDAEHFFDAWRDDAGYALECLRAAVAAGAENVTLCDTNGSSLPVQVAAATRAVVGRARRAGRGRDPHPQRRRVRGRELARRGRGRCAPGPGHGQRLRRAVWQREPGLGAPGAAAEARATSACPPTGCGCSPRPPTSLTSSPTPTPDPDQPYVGRNAFAHKGGMHVAGVQADARTFEHLDPELVGNSRDVLISELSGRGSVLSRAENAGIDLDADAAKRVVERVKEREHRGYHYEAADASFELLLRREAGAYQPLFRLEGYRVIVEKNENGYVDTQATIKLWVDGTRYLHTAEGDGPVNALDRALRVALQEHHPELPHIELTNFKVRLIEGAHGTGAITRVLLDSTDHEREWGSIGVSENIIEASWEALVDSLEYAFQPQHARVS